MRHLKTTGNASLDTEIEELEARVRALEAATTPVQAVQPPIQPPTPLRSYLIVREADGSPSLSVAALEFDSADGFVLTEGASGDSARIDRAATTATPTAQSAAGTAGTATTAANDDHAHAPVLTTKGDILGYGSLPARLAVGTNGQVLTAASGQATGLQWATPTSVSGWDFARITNSSPTLAASAAKDYIRVFDDAVTGRTLTLPDPTLHARPIFIRALNAPIGGHAVARSGGGVKIDGAAADITLGTIAGLIAEIGLMSDGTDWFSFYRRTI